MNQKFQNILIICCVTLSMQSFAQAKPSSEYCERYPDDSGCVVGSRSNKNISVVKSDEQNRFIPNSSSGIIGYKALTWGQSVNNVNGLVNLDSCQYLMKCYEMENQTGQIKKKVVRFYDESLVSILVQFVDEIKLDEYKEIENDLRAPLIIV